MIVAALLVVSLASGCAKMGIKKPSVTITPAQATTREHVESSPNSSENEAAPPASLSTIVRRYLQNGHYAEGEKALRSYLQEHPGDRTAQFFLRQLTEDPKQMLGAASSAHVVQPGESYSTLAAKYLGDPNLFLVLARYNGSTNPALILVGSTLQLPGAQNGASVAAASPSSPASSAAPAASVTSNAPPPVTAPVVLPAPVKPTQRAQQLEGQSLALYRQGQKDQALSLFDQALALNPHLKSSDPDFVALSRVWEANSHQQAMVLYLDQHLDQAIALWDRILIVDPAYEPAAVYRTRALELKQRLQQY
ncbi:LysM peptidoglycan-binding domain-containing protein [Dyella flagellata]|uniref:LysM domain-containing protein n=1 Tax=Dyella flagellata TaxID=1867833 RepID=A0ABQ5X870_9GAMM|nr:tetratricopeptide repeat protein [Dyella flagellata]GLQ87429.1 hypothetical protein GCM10007898_09950 [Dyella flagellata]